MSSSFEPERLIIPAASALFAAISFGTVFLYDKPSGPGAPLEGIHNLYFLGAGAFASVVCLFTLISAIASHQTKHKTIVFHQIKLRFLDDQGKPIRGQPALWQANPKRPDRGVTVRPDDQGWGRFVLESGTIAHCLITPQRRPLKLILRASMDGESIEIEASAGAATLRLHPDSEPAGQLVLCPAKEQPTVTVQAHSEVAA